MQLFLDYSSCFIERLVFLKKQSQILEVPEAAF